MEKERKNDYSAKDIQILEGLEPVRKRPAMYIGSTGPEGVQHLLVEIVGNATDEALAGFADKIEVTFFSEKRIMVEDNGRGIPVDTHEKTKKSALETIITYLHSGAKFGGNVYKVSGGLHGVGLSVVCALSKYLKARVKREGKIFEQEYARGKPLTPLKIVGKSNETGTSIIFEPDPEIFKEIKFDKKKIIHYLREQAFLSKKIRYVFIDKSLKGEKKISFCFENGLASYLKYLVRGRKMIHENIFYLEKTENGVFMEIAFCYTDEFESYEETFANNINTKEGGYHLVGFRSGLTKSFNEWAKKKEIIKKKEDSLTRDDLKEGLNALISVRITNPEFEGQTKAKLGNPEVKAIVERVLSASILEFFEMYPQDAKSIVEKCLLVQKARKAAKAAKEAIVRKSVLNSLALPGKLADCITKRPEEAELFIVEGESAGGSCKLARDRRFQAILPLRGKILNVERARIDKIFSSKEIKVLILALGAGVGDDFNIEKIRYHKIIIAVDADVDGNHIKTLLLTLFWRYFRPVIERGYLYIAHPPLYRFQLGKEIKYLFSEEEKEKLLKSLKNKNISFQRYKGLGEMNPEQLWETTMDPKKRILIRVTIEDAKEADKVFDILMGDEVFPRKKFIQNWAKTVKNLDI
ncbi:MAG: DNA gyrase/topoisomerase IV subunit B [Minisyncoccales bacterium]